MNGQEAWKAHEASRREQRKEKQRIWSKKRAEKKAADKAELISKNGLEAQKATKKPKLIISSLDDNIGALYKAESVADASRWTGVSDFLISKCLEGGVVTKRGTERIESEKKTVTKISLQG